MSADAQPTLPLPPSQTAPAPRRRRGLRWMIALLVLLVVLAAAAVIAEWLARSTTESTIRQLIVERLNLPADQAIDVEVAGIVLPQLISGTLDDVTVSSDDVALGPVTADITVQATQIPVRGDAPAGGGTGEVRFDEAQLRTLLGTIEGFPADAVGIAAPDVTLSTELDLFGAKVPIGVALTPGVAEGDLTLTPARLTVGGADLTADGVRDRFGRLADPLLQQRAVCIAQYLPVALTLTSVAVEGDQVVGAFDVDGRVVVDPAIQQNGTCS